MSMTPWRVRYFILTLLLLGGAACMPALAREAPTTETATRRILIVGDSWAELPWKMRTMREVLGARGLGAYAAEGTTTALGGTTIAQWKTDAYLNKIRAALAAHPTIDIMHLSITGNDLLRGLARDPAAETTPLLNAIEADLEQFMQACLDIEPRLRIAMCGYDFLNLEETADPGHATHSEFGLFAREKLGHPSPEKLNRWFLALGKRQRAVAGRHARVVYVQNHGVCQVRFGPERMPMPGQAPGFDPWPGGRVDRPSPLAAMGRLEGEARDWLHLNAEGYRAMFENMVDVVYADWLKNPARGPAERPLRRHPSSGDRATAPPPSGSLPRP